VANHLQNNQGVKFSDKNAAENRDLRPDGKGSKQGRADASKKFMQPLSNRIAVIRPDAAECGYPRTIRRFDSNLAESST
jgi:hypothetical protein